MNAKTFISTAVATAALALAAPAASLAASMSWNDESGDAPAGVPDIQGVSVSMGADELVTWTIAMPNVAGLGPGIFVDIRIDSDGLLSTGNEGIDHLIRVDGSANTVSLLAWNGSSFAAVAPAGLSATGSFPLRVTVARSAIGDPTTLWFWLRAWNYAAASNPPCCYDDAPSTAFYRLDLATAGTTAGSEGTIGGANAPAAPTSPPALPSLPPSFGAPPSARPPGAPAGSGQQESSSTPGQGAATAETSAAMPSTALAIERLVTTRTSTALTFRLFLIRDATGARITNGRVRCHAKAAGRTLRLVSAGFSAGAAVCRFAVPRQVARAAITGRATVSSGGASLTRDIRVRRR